MRVQCVQACICLVALAKRPDDGVDIVRDWFGTRNARPLLGATNQRRCATQ